MDNEVVRITVVAELFTRDFDCDEIRVISFCISISNQHKSAIV